MFEWTNKHNPVFFSIKGVTRQPIDRNNIRKQELKTSEKTHLILSCLFCNLNQRCKHTYMCTQTPSDQIYDILQHNRDKWQCIVVWNEKMNGEAIKQRIGKEQLTLYVLPSPATCLLPCYMNQMVFFCCTIIILYGLCSVYGSCSFHRLISSSQKFPLHHGFCWRMWGFVVGKFHQMAPI